MQQGALKLQLWCLFIDNRFSYSVWDIFGSYCKVARYVKIIFEILQYIYCNYLLDDYSISKNESGSLHKKFSGAPLATTHKCWIISTQCWVK